MAILAEINNPIEIIILTYFAAGLVFALIFVFWGAGLIDEHAKHSSFGFKIMILPASIILYPLVAPVFFGKLIVFLTAKRTKRLQEKKTDKTKTKGATKRIAKPKKKASEKQASKKQASKKTGKQK